MSTATTLDDFPEIRWHGHWIWTPEEAITPAAGLTAAGDPNAPERHALFRKRFHLDRVPDRAPARITADSRYILFVNGQEVFCGPIRSQPRRLHYDFFDLAPYLRPGENVLAVYVKYYGRPNSYWMPAAPNLTLGKTGVLVFEANLGAAGWLVSDAGWKARCVEAWSDEWRHDIEDPVGGGVPVEVFDARRFPHGWQEAEFDDSDWGAAQVIPAMHIGGFARTQPPTDPYGPLYPRPIAKLGGQLQTPATIRVEELSGVVDPSVVSPNKRVRAAAALRPLRTASVAHLPVTVEVSFDNIARLSLDMGRIVSGFVTFEIQAPPGAVLDLAYLEEPLLTPSSNRDVHSGARYIARGEHDRFQAFESNGFRYAYILVHGVQGPVTLQSFAVQEHLYSWTESGSFACDDEMLNRIFAAGIRTVQLCSHDAFIDCPTREQRAWVGDGVVHQMVHLATNSDWRLARHYLTLGNSPRADGMLPMSVAGDIEAKGAFTIPDWALHWVHGLYNWYRFSGDREFVAGLMPTAERVLRWYAPYQTQAGVLKDVPEWNLVDWSSVLVNDTSSLLTALWARGLREFAEMAGWLEDRGRQRWAEALYARARAGFELFWDEARGSYIDHIVDGERRPEMSQLAGALAIVSGLAPEARWGRIVDVITDPARLVVRSWVGGEQGEYSQEKIEKQLQGIYAIDWDAEREIVLAEPFMSYVVHDAVAQAGKADRLPDLYRRWSEFLVNGYDTIGECWGWGTHVHGWSCTPTRDMIFYTLGVTPAEPGYATARIAPRLGRLRWAKGNVPTPHGMISVEASPERVMIDSPVPVVVDLVGRPVRELPAGRHEIAI
ncbi:MAG: alpha-L-rhamnosidase N-terminal domain-containing protein [Anaerolineales bacterium]|nr:alpha-L-rhamnosidase N-terminal domain-containing protein [Anaerolineales bacterium]